MVLTRKQLLYQLKARSEHWYSEAVSTLRHSHDSETRGLVSDRHTAFDRGLEIDNCDESCMSLVGYDFRVGEQVYLSKNRVPSFRSMREFEEAAMKGDIKKVKDKQGKVVLRPDPRGSNVYLVPSLEAVSVPKGEFTLEVDAKSTTGRLACMCVDQSGSFMERQLGVACPVVVSTQPYKFPIEITLGRSKLAQGVFRYALSDAMSVEQILADGDNIRLMREGRSVDLRETGRMKRYGTAMKFNTACVLKAKSRIKEPIDIDAREVYEVSDAFEVIDGNSSFTLSPREFYLLGTLETIGLGNVCGLLSRETPDTGTGLWGHFAGVIQPFWQGEITMECRSEVAREIRSGDDAGFVQFEKIRGEDGKEPQVEGSYLNQKAPRAPKMFKDLS